MADSPDTSEVMLGRLHLPAVKRLVDTLSAKEVSDGDSGVTTLPMDGHASTGSGDNTGLADSLLRGETDPTSVADRVLAGARVATTATSTPIAGADVGGLHDGLPFGLSTLVPDTGSPKKGPWLGEGWGRRRPTPIRMPHGVNDTVTP
jgi:hypothetical protein